MQTRSRHFRNDKLFLLVAIQFLRNARARTYTPIIALFIHSCSNLRSLIRFLLFASFFPSRSGLISNGLRFLHSFNSPSPPLFSLPFFLSRTITDYIRVAKIYRLLIKASGRDEISVIGV